MCTCQPIREHETYQAEKIHENKKNGSAVFDIGQTISGYIRLTAKGESGQTLTIRYAEDITQDYSLNFNGGTHHYKESPYATDKLICNGESITWSPKFAYHGFRYIEISGLNGTEKLNVSGVFVHQAVQPLSGFTCSDKRLERLFQIGQKAVLSNLFYMPTDCPSREKLGWANDAQASAEQMLINFDLSDLFKKWLQDIYDAMRENGDMPGIIPSPGWGYDWGNGPVSDGVLFEIPSMLYLYTGEAKPLLNSRPYFARYIAMIERKKNNNGFFGFGLNDWASPGPVETPLDFICSALYVKFLRIADFAEQLAGNRGIYEKLIADETEHFKTAFICRGRCVIDEQTAVAMVISLKLYDDLEPLKKQLAELVEKRHFHHHCGMVGLRYLYDALDICQLHQYAYRIITATGYPSYFDWLEKGATALWEYWQGGTSKNHHMYSDFMAWIMKTLLGIQVVPQKPGFAQVNIVLNGFEGPCFCSGYRDTPNGRVAVSRKRQGDHIRYDVDVPAGLNVSLVVGGIVSENILTPGKHNVMIPVDKTQAK